jgi:hypothetical protein
MRKSKKDFYAINCGKDGKDKKLVEGSYRDSQRKKLYLAEKEVQKIIESPVLSVNEAHALVKKYLPAIKVRFPKKGQKAYFMGCKNLISLPTSWALKKYVVLHEIAHGICHYNHIVASHGPVYATVFMNLLLMECGQITFNLMSLAFRAHKVKYVDWMGKDVELASLILKGMA